MLSRLPETDEDSKNKEVDLNKEIWPTNITQLRQSPSAQHR